MFFFCLSVVCWVYAVFCFLVFDCQCRCNRLPGKIRLQNYLLYVDWDVKPYSPTHLIMLPTGFAFPPVHVSSDDCQEDKREGYRSYPVPYCMPQKLMGSS